MLATSVMTEAKPPSDAHILSFGWDSAVGYGSQLAITDTDNGYVTLYTRGANTTNNVTSLKNSVWTAVLDANNFANYASKKDHTHDTMTNDEIDKLFV